MSGNCRSTTQQLEKFNGDLEAIEFSIQVFVVRWVNKYKKIK